MARLDHDGVFDVPRRARGRRPGSSGDGASAPAGLEPSYVTACGGAASGAAYGAGSADGGALDRAKGAIVGGAVSYLRREDHRYA
jgi:hypothetical protein